MDEDLKVCDLIDPTTGQWDEETIKNIFGQQDIRDILSIPLRQGMEDTIAWHFDKKGVFSVRSCYQLGIHLRDHQEQRDTSSSAIPSARSPLWNTIWNLKLPGKVRIFLWRLCHNSLPTRMNIKRKRVELDTICPMCYRADEDGGHLFLKCKKVRQVWRELLMEDTRMMLLEAPNPKLMMESVFTLHKVKQILS
jgi:hypothetical protein